MRMRGSVQTILAIFGVQQLHQPAAHDRWNQHLLQAASGQFHANSEPEEAIDCTWKKRMSHTLNQAET